MANSTAAKAAPRKRPVAGTKPASRAKTAAPAGKSSTGKRSTAAKAPVTVKAKPAKATPAARRPASPRTAPKTAGTKPRTHTSRAPKPKAMEVSYSGRIFRSRLEARWAVFLDMLDINWDYEPCFYEVGPELFYLPDFYLPDHRLWLEVKGAPFMDSASMAKCLGAVAGPSRIPLREAPYTPSDRLLLGGPFRRLQHRLQPVHVLITPAGEKSADLSWSVFDVEPDGRAVVRTAGSPWDTVPATGVKAARRPAPARLQQLLEPEPHLGVMHDRVGLAYRTAYTLAFGEGTKRLSDTGNPHLLKVLTGRRSGRPLGQAA